MRRMIIFLILIFNTSILFSANLPDINNKSNDTKDISQVEPVTPLTPDNIYTDIIDEFNTILSNFIKKEDEFKKEKNAEIFLELKSKFDKFKSKNENQIKSMLELSNQINLDEPMYNTIKKFHVNLLYLELQICTYEILIYLNKPI